MNTCISIDWTAKGTPETHHGQHRNDDSIASGVLEATASAAHLTSPLKAAKGCPKVAMLVGMPGS